MKKIRTVLGDIAPEELGYTLAHEHVIANQSKVIGCFWPSGDAIKASSPAFAARPETDGVDCTLENLMFIQKGGWIMGQRDMDADADKYFEFIVKELEYYKAAGGSALIEPTYDSLSNRSQAELVEFSKRTGVHIVSCIGQANPSFGLYPERMRGKTEDEMKKIFDEEVETGMYGCGVKPGVLKALLSSGADEELIHFRALARVAKETGLGLTTHVQIPMTVEDILHVIHVAVDEIGLPKEKLLINHVGSFVADGQMLADYLKTMDCKINLEGIQKILDTGVYVSFDNFSNHSCQTSEFWGNYCLDDYATINVVYQLIEKGYASQIMLGHDFCSMQMGIQNGHFGYTRVPNFVCPMLAQLCGQDKVDQMMITNPMNFLAF